MREFREIVGVPPTVLHVADLEELQEMLIDGLRSHSHLLRVTAKHGVTRYKGDTVQKLLKGNQPGALDAIEFEVQGWTPSDEIDRGITVTLGPWSSDFQIHANDETWFRGKKQQISDFLRARRPWFARSGWRAVPALLWVAPGGLLLATGLLAVARFWSAAAFAAIATVGSYWRMLHIRMADFFVKLKLFLHPRSE